MKYKQVYLESICVTSAKLHEYSEELEHVRQNDKYRHLKPLTYCVYFDRKQVHV